MLFSLLCPTRHRPHNIVGLFQNLHSTINDREIKNVELLLISDEDDKETHVEIEQLAKGLWCFQLKILKRPRSEFLNRDYYNYLIQFSTGKYLWAIADDVRFRTHSWDLNLEQHIERFLENKPDRIAYVSVCEIQSQAKHPCFPLITKEAFDVLNEYHCSELMSWGSDRILWEIYSHPNINRVLNVNQVVIQHLTYHDGTAVFDETAKSMKERFFRDPDCHNKVSLYRVPQQRKILERHIKEYNARMEK